MDKQPMTALTTATSKSDTNRSTAIHEPVKKVKRVKKLVALKLLKHRSLIEPEALALYGETCLHSTISTLWNTHNIKFIRVPEKYGVFDARFTRYTLHPDSTKAANDLIKHYEQKLKGAA